MYYINPGRSEFRARSGYKQTGKHTGTERLVLPVELMGIVGGRKPRPPSRFARLSAQVNEGMTEALGTFITARSNLPDGARDSREGSHNFDPRARDKRPNFLRANSTVRYNPAVGSISLLSFYSARYDSALIRVIFRVSGGNGHAAPPGRARALLSNDPLIVDQRSFRQELTISNHPYEMPPLDSVVNVVE